MTRSHVSTLPSGLSRTLIATALAAAFTNALGDEAGDRVNALRMDLATPDSRIEAGIGVVNHDNRRAGQYNGRSDDGGYGLLDLNLIRRDPATGAWLKFRGKNVGLDTRELRFDHERQGDWAYFVEASQMSRHEPLAINTGLQGIGTARQSVNFVAPGAGQNVDLRLDHDIVAFGARKFVAGNFEIRASFKQDEKRGDRMYGRGTTNGVAPPIGFQEFLTEPVDQTTRLWDLVLGYADPKLQLSGGYSGTWFQTRTPRLDIIADTTPASPFAAQGLTAFALPPSNYSHQLHLAGGYNFGQYTRTSFKLSRSLAVRDDPFAITPTLAGAPTTLKGTLVTTLAFADISTRPADRLDITASLRYEDRDDKTPTSQFITRATPTPGAGFFPFSTAGITGFNKPRSLQQVKGLVEAGYQLGGSYRLIGSLEQEQITRNVPVEFRRVGFRDKTDETSIRAEIKGMIADNINGGLAYIHSDRGGSDYSPDTYDPAANTNQVNPLIWADRRRDKLRFTLDWTPDDQWSVQFLGDFSDDDYSGRSLGPRKGTSRFVSADAAYSISDKWKLSAYVSQERMTAEQSTRTDLLSPSVPVASQNIIWAARLRNVTTAWGLTLKGKPRTDLELVADLSSSTDTAEHRMGQIGGTGTTPVNSLPEYFYRQLSLKLSADYAIERNSGVRANFVFDRRRNNDWTWNNYVYSDGTTVTNPAQENVSFLGATYYYRWR